MNTAIPALSVRRLHSSILALTLGIIMLEGVSHTSSAGTVELFPGDDIQAAVDANPENTTFILKPGVHRMQDVTPKSNTTFQGEPGAIMNGSRVLADWTFDGTYYKHTGQTQQGQVHGDCISGYGGCSLPEDIYVNNEPLWQETSLAAVGPGEWYFDYNADTVYMKDDPTGKTVEIGVSRRAFGGSASNVTIKGLIIEKYAIPAQMGAIGDQYPGAAWVIENNEVRYNHGTGITFSGAAIVRNNNVHHNGQKGIGGTGVGGLIEGNEIAHNNYAGFDWGWEAGGTKFAKTENLVVRNNFVHHNNGPGLWTDIDNTNTLFEGNTVEYNQAMGIFHEISFAATIKCNTVRYNAVGCCGWLYGAQIMISTSSNVEVYHNTVIVDAAGGNGITIVNQNRGAAYYSRDNYVHDNDVTYKGNIGQSGAATDYDHANFWANGNNRFNYNRYHAPDLNGTRWAWNDAARNWADFQAQGQEANGAADTDLNYSPSFPCSGGGGGTGDGLSGEYFDNSDFTTLAFTRVDATVNFDWGSGSPDPSMGADTFSIRWTGEVQPRYSETYTFYTTSDDGVRLWVNDVLLIDNWTDHPPTENSGTIALNAEQRYSVRLDYYENGGGAVAQLRWSSASQPKEIIPQSRLFSAPSSVPTAPSGLSASAVSSSQINLTWTDNSNDETGFKIERKTGAGGTWSQITTTGADVSSYNNTGLTASTTYHYRVRATNAAGDSSYSNEASATTSGAQGPFGGTPWPIPGRIEAEDYDTGGESIAYHDVDAGNTGGQYRSDDVDVKATTDTGAGYAIGWFNAGEWLEYTVDISTAGTYDIQIRVGSALAGRTFHIEFDGVDKTGTVNVPQMADWDQYQTVTVSAVSLNAGQQVMRLVMGSLDYMDLNWIEIVSTSAAPAAPSNLSASVASACQINLSWTDNSSDETEFKIERKTGSDGTWSQIATTAANVTTYSNTELIAGTSYFYRVRASNGSGDSAYSNEAGASTTAAPSAPSGLSATAISSSQIDLSWTDNSSTENAFHIERSTDNVNFSLVATTGANATFYSNIGLANATTYYYRVRASDSCGHHSAYSNTASTTTLAHGPYGGTPWPVPGNVEAENYDVGGQDLAYFDFDAGNSGGEYRTDDVDIKASTDTGGGYAIGWFKATEWLKYTIQVDATATYDIKVRVGSIYSGRTFHIEFNGVDMTGPTAVPVVAAWDQYQTVTITGVSLAAGQQVMRVVMGSLDYMDLNWIEIAPTAGLPSPWNNQDIGTVGAAGSASHNTGTFTVRGAGADIWGTADAFHYVYQSASDSCEIKARVTEVQNTDPWAKAGVMIRESLNANSKHAMMVLTPGNGLAFQRRTSTGGTSTHTSGGAATAPYWVRIVRSGNTITAYHSADGATWTTVGSETISMSSTVFIGLAVTSHVSGTINTSTFDNVVAQP